MARDPTALTLVAVCSLVALVMALITLSRADDLPAVVVLREDAYGNPNLWGPPKSIWQLPLLVAMVSLINLVLAAAVARFDRFACRFLLASAVVISLVAWVPLGRFLF